MKIVLTDSQQCIIIIIIIIIGLLGFGLETKRHQAFF